MNKRVDVIMTTGERRRGYASTEHAASSYGQPVILIDGIPHGPRDTAMIGAKVVVGGDDVVSALVDAGFDAVPTQTVSVAAKVPADLHHRISAKAESMGLTMSKAVVKALEAWAEE